MGYPNPELNRTAMLACCGLISKNGALSVSDLMVMGNLGDSLTRRSIALGIKLGYLFEAPKRERLGKGNRLKTYLRTKKRLPSEQPALAVEERELDMSAFTPRRDWAVVALFGPYEARA